DVGHVALMLALAPAIALVVRFVLPEKSAEGEYVSQKVLCFASVLTVQFLGLFGSIWEIVKEQSIYRHERNVNLRIVPYLASKAVPLAAVGLVQSLLVLAVVAGRLEPHLQAVHVLALWLSSLSGTALGLAISA